MLLMDDYTSFTWVYFLAHKSQAEDMLRTFVMQQAASGKLISKIRTDNGGEFTSSAIADFLLRGVSFMPGSPPYTP
jgi:transposase InsO family protein